jgi:predicted NUDIX family NTP pyrophosphohydrolase
MEKFSAGILLYRIKKPNSLEVFLLHPGGPFYIKKDKGVWSIPKGEFDKNENPLEAAKREFKEEIGNEINGDFIELSPIITKSKKTIIAWAVEGDIDQSEIKSNTFEMEWPPKSGKIQKFPEMDRGEWFYTFDAREKIHEAQISLIDELLKKMNLSESKYEERNKTLFD